MRNSESQIGADRPLYPHSQPYNFDMLAVDGGHKLYYEQCGNPTGIPVIVLHGGPGGGCSPSMRRFFNPKTYRIILFDQRGCGRSRPHASVENNTTQDLIADIERIREKLGISKWIVFGGSWGATLALLYAQAHPDRALHLVLRGVFLMTKPELDWFYQGGVARFYPDSWKEFIADLPEDERGDVIAAFHRRLFGTDEPEQTYFARLWTRWESSLATIADVSGGHSAPASYARAFARIENHYFVNGGFIDEGQILRDMPKIANIQGTIVQGRYDMICPPVTAYRLHESWPMSRLLMIQSAGHSLSESGISSALVGIMDDLT
jgi:proline iminopeptidase